MIRRIQRFALSLLAVGIAMPLAAQDAAEETRSDEWLVASALLAAPVEHRADAEVRRRSTQEVLRRGTGMICLTDNPGDETFAAACYSRSLEPYMARGRELVAQGMERQARIQLRFDEVESGKISMPEKMGMVFNLNFACENFDPATANPAAGGRLHAVYSPFITPANTGLPAAPGGGTEPWIMYPGTGGSHIMVAVPAVGDGPC